VICNVPSSLRASASSALLLMLSLQNLSKNSRRFSTALSLKILGWPSAVPRSF